MGLIRLLLNPVRPPSVSNPQLVPTSRMGGGARGFAAFTGFTRLFSFGIGGLRRVASCSLASLLLSGCGPFGAPMTPLGPNPDEVRQRRRPSGEPCDKEQKREEEKGYSGKALRTSFSLLSCNGLEGSRHYFCEVATT